MDNEYFASINEVSRRLDIPAHTLRYWEKQFPTIIRPTTGAGGRRYYRAETVERLTTVRELLYTRGMTIAGVKKLLRDGQFPQSGANFNLGTSAPSVTTQNIDVDAIDTAITLLNGAKKILL